MSGSSVRVVLRQARSRAHHLELGSTAAYKALGLGLGLVANIGAVALLTSKFGVEEYAAYALIASLLFLLPFADLGLGAGIVNAISDVHAQRLSSTVGANVVARSRALLAAISVVLISLSMLALGTGSLQLALGTLGQFPPAVLAAAVTISVFAFTLPFGVGNRILQGMGKVGLNVKLGLISPICTIALLTALYFMNAHVSFFLMTPCISYFAVHVTTYVVAKKLCGLPKASARAACSRGGTQGFPLARTALPFFIVSIGMTIGFQSHRLIISHLGTPEAVAAYSLVAQFAGPVSAILATTGQNLWSRYRSTSPAERSSRRFFGDVALFSVLGSGSAILLIASVLIASYVIAGGQISITSGLVASAAFYVLIVAMHQPGAMFLTDPRGLKSQAVMVLLVSIVSISGIFFAYPVIGLAAPYLIYALTVGCIQLVPTWLIVVSRLK
ncbi:lipopolysaccharide biosynthesis protein [Kocuria rosea]|uniref:Polysaccharide biosynthesis protein n=1 Tax=Kocuria rosea TaxID=1275 RepID=A0A4R5Y315_KOCRO|nr:hypothetical protein [Kocuria rosea]TDL37472.1 hypothetical protein E2R59_17905 [Kocuria rosea]